MAYRNLLHISYKDSRNKGEKIMGKITGICISEKRGVQKHYIEEANIIKDWGIEGDAHGGKWHRQISLLSKEKVDDFKAKGADIHPGSFGENLIVEGFDFSAMPVGTRFVIGDVVLEMTQIGKECHNHCVIYKKMGDCIMPREGVFAEVVKGGHIKVGQEVTCVLPKTDRPYTAAVITLSDKGAAGEREDKSGPAIVEMLEEAGYDMKEALLIPDEQALLEKELMRLSDQRQINVIFTTGGTGFSERDRTPEATIAVCDRMANGIAEAIRNYSMTITPRAMFSRAVSGIRKKTLIINLPGSPKAVKEALEFLLPNLEHGLGILRGTEGECGRK